MPLKLIKLFYLHALAVCILHADYIDDIGLSVLRTRDASLDGNGITVAQVEAARGAGGDWQTDPADTGLNSNKFTYYQLTSPYPIGTSYNSSLESAHANRVGALFFGLTGGTQGTDGVAPGIDSIEMFYADYYYASNPINASIVRSTPQTETNAEVVNQSFVFDDTYDFIDKDYDDYASIYNVLFCNGIFTDPNPSDEDIIDTTITSPASSYNCIAVGTIDDTSLIPLIDGRSKPDIVAPSKGGLGIYSSYTTPVVSGAATLLIQSGARDDAGPGTSADATDIRTIKALLLNSATKPSGWSHTSTRPLDIINGAGILEINQAQLQLAAGQYSETIDDTVTDSGSSHLPPTGISSNVSSNMGWNLGTLTNERVTGQRRDSTDHYYFECDAAEASTFNLTATLVWNRNTGRTNINNLDLFLYKEDGTLVASSVSTVDNVEHLYELALDPGRYVLQAHKPATGRDSNTETYALAFHFETGAPVAADNASATTQSSTSILLNWNDNSGNETGYRIERRINGGNYSTLTTLGPDTESYTDTTCTAETSYDYQIIAYNDHGDAPAATASATTYSLQEDWRLTYFGTTANSGNAADDFDFDLDSMVNLVEFATGSDPTTFSPNPLDASSLGTIGQVSFDWRVDSGFDFSIGYSNDLTAGFTYYDSTTLDNDLGPELEHISTSGAVDGIETRTYGVRNSVTDANVFLRLLVE